MSQWLKQSTAVILKLGPFLDDVKGKTPKTALSIAQGDIQISKNGGTFAQTSAASPTTTHDADGWYPIPLTTADTNTLGTLVVQVAMTGALPVWIHCMVVPANVYDSLILGPASDYLDVNVYASGDKSDYRLSSTGVDDILDEVVEGSYTVRQYLRAIASVLFAKVSGGATPTVTFRDTGDSKDRIVATVDGDGNRSAVTLTLT